MDVIQERHAPPSPVAPPCSRCVPFFDKASELAPSGEVAYYFTAKAIALVQICTDLDAPALDLALLNPRDSSQKRYDIYAYATGSAECARMRPVISAMVVLTFDCIPVTPSRLT